MSFDRYRSDSESRRQERHGRSGERGREDRFREEELDQRGYSEGYGEGFGRQGMEGQGRMGGFRGERSWRPGDRFEREESSRGRYAGVEGRGEFSGRSYGEEFGQGASQVWNEPRYRGSRETSGGRREPWSGEDFRGQESYGSYGSSYGSGGRTSGSERDSGYGWSQGQDYGSSMGSSYGSSSYGSERGSSFGSSGRGFSGESFFGSYGGGTYRGSERSSLRGRFTGKGPKGYQRSDDRIKEDVSDLLERNGELDASDIEVQVSSGEVTLTGNVSERSSKRLAEDLIEDLPGVKQVHNRLRVGNGSETSGSSGSESTSGRSGSSRSGSTSTTSSRSGS